jgi:hypothetical protein
MMNAAREWEPESRICLACHLRLPLDQFAGAITHKRSICIICYEEGRATPELIALATKLRKCEWQQRWRNIHKMAKIAALRAERAITA